MRDVSPFFFFYYYFSVLNGCRYTYVFISSIAITTSCFLSMLRLSYVVGLCSYILRVVVFAIVAEACFYPEIPALWVF